MKNLEVYQAAVRYAVMTSDTRLRDQCISHLEKHWKDHRAAQAFYTALELVRPLPFKRELPSGVSRLPRFDVEDRIVSSVIHDLLDAGYRVAVDDGEEIVLSHTRDAVSIFRAMMTTDEDRLLACDASGAVKGWVRFIYGNEGSDVMSDWTVSLEGALERTLALVDEYA